jgi:hypothetical protein
MNLSHQHVNPYQKTRNANSLDSGVAYGITWRHKSYKTQLCTKVMKRKLCT